MKSKDLLASHYNQKYKFRHENTVMPDKIMVKKYPRNRFEAVVYWGKGKGRVLEIGAGAGKVLFSLKNYYDEYIATELSSERVKNLEKFFDAEAKIKIIQNDIEEQNLPYPEEYFDVIIMISVIEHLIEPISTVKYCYSLLKPGGNILIHTPNIAKWTRRLKLFFGFFPSTGSLDEGFLTHDGESVDLCDDAHLHYFTFRSLKKLLKEKAGFKEVKYCGHGKTFLSRVMPTLFSECFIVAIK